MVRSLLAVFLACATGWTGPTLMGQTVCVIQRATLGERANVALSADLVTTAGAMGVGGSASAAHGLAGHGLTGHASTGPALGEGEAVVHSGTVELTPVDALRSARELVAGEQRRLLQRSGEEFASRHAPSWLPSTYRDRVVHQWNLDLDGALIPEVLDRDDIVRDHGFGPSFQTKLLVRHVGPSSEQLRTLEHRLQQAGERLVALSGGTLALWTVLALAFWWMDRLTRGYMSGRLAILATLCGVAVPALGFAVL